MRAALPITDTSLYLFLVLTLYFLRGRLVHFEKRFEAEQVLASATLLNGKHLNMSWHTPQSSQSSANGKGQSGGAQERGGAGNGHELGGHAGGRKNQD